jgi:hypothetical protein
MKKMRVNTRKSITKHKHHTRLFVQENKTVCNDVKVLFAMFNAFSSFFGKGAANLPVTLRRRQEFRRFFKGPKTGSTMEWLCTPYRISSEKRKPKIDRGQTTTQTASFIAASFRT